MNAARLTLVALLALTACGNPTVAAPTPVNRVAQCQTDLTAEYQRWKKNPAVEINPKSCDQPGVTYTQYQAAWRNAGGAAVWVADPGTTTTKGN